MKVFALLKRLHLEAGRGLDPVGGGEVFRVLAGLIDLTPREGQGPDPRRLRPKPSDSPSSPPWMEKSFSKMIHFRILCESEIAC